jgi:hypothetical protein
MLATEVLGASGAPQGTISSEMAGTSVSRRAAPGDAASARGSSGAMSPGLPGTYLQGSSGSASLPVNCRRVENETEFACSQVATAEWLLHKALPLVHCNILRLVRVSLRNRAGILPMSSTTSSLLTCFSHASFPHHQSQDSGDVTSLQVDMIWAWGPSSLSRPIVLRLCLSPRLSLRKALRRRTAPPFTSRMQRTRPLW